MDLIIFIIAILFLVAKTNTEWVLVIMMALATSLFQASYMFEGMLYIPNMYDGGLIIMFALLLKYLWKKPERDVVYKNTQKYVLIFAIFILFTIAIDIIVNGTSIISVIKTCRHWLFLLAFFIFPKIPLNILSKVLKITLYITLVISVINIINFLTGNINLYEQDVARGALPPTYALFYTFLITCNYFKIGKFKKSLFLALLVTALLISSTRSIAIAILLGVIICIYYTSHNRAYSIRNLIILTFISIAVIAMHPGLRTRFYNLSSEIKTSQQYGDTEGNMTYRLFHTAERYEYISSNTQYHLFGIGNIREKDFPHIFSIGLYDEEMRRPTQLDTGDITWSLVLLRVGVIGLILFVMLFYKVAKTAFKKREQKLATTLFVYIVTNILVISFAGTTPYTASFWLMPTICLCIIYNSETKKMINNKNT